MSISKPKTHSSIWGYAKIKEHTREPSTFTGNLDMKHHKITNMAEPRMRTDAATAGYVSNYVSHLQNAKVALDGGTMTGDLSMGNNKLTHLGTPEDDGDAVNKEYADSKDFSIDVMGRYIIIVHNGIKQYFSVRAEKNINLDNGLVALIKYITNDENLHVLNATPDKLAIQSDTTLINQPGKGLGIIQLNQQLSISFDLAHLLPPPWTLLFSVKHSENQAIYNRISASFLIRESFDNIHLLMRFSPITGKFEYNVGESTINAENSSAFDTVIGGFNHIAFAYDGERLILWVNGIQQGIIRGTNLGDMNAIYIDIMFLGALSLYDRKLGRAEIVQHFIDFNVKNFTDDDVLI